MKKAALVVGMALIWTGTCWAQEGVWNSLDHRYGLYGCLGYAAYTMKDANAEIDRTNQFFSSNLGKITGGLDLGLGLVYGFSDFIQVGAEIGTVTGGTKGNPVPDTTVEWNVPAYEAGLFVSLTAPLEDTFLLSLGAGIYSLSVDTASYVTDDPYFGHRSSDLRGTGLGYKFTGGAQVFLGEHLALGAELGYRLAKITELTDGGSVKWLNADGTNFTLDYSGVFGRGGVYWYF
jgi:hypothetical protein